MQTRRTLPRTERYTIGQELDRTMVDVLVLIQRINSTHKFFERTFIADCYSCIEGRGTHYGVERLKKHIRSCSQNWSKPCYVLKLDIKGYFMSINRERLLARCRELLGRVALRRDRRRPV